MSWSFYPQWGWGYDEYDAFRRRRDADHDRARQREEEERRERRRAEERAQALKKHQQEVALKAKQKSLNRQYDTCCSGHAATDGEAGAPASLGETGIISSRCTKLNRGGFFDGSLGVQTYNTTSPEFAEKGARQAAGSKPPARRPQGAAKPALNRAGFFDCAGAPHGPDPPNMASGCSRPGFFDCAAQPEEEASASVQAGGVARRGGAGLTRAGFTTAAAAPKPQAFPRHPVPEALAPDQRIERVEPGATSLAGTSKIGSFIKW